jgi:hypothetical protein
VALSFHTSCRLQLARSRFFAALSQCVARFAMIEFTEYSVFCCVGSKWTQYAIRRRSKKMPEKSRHADAYGASYLIGVSPLAHEAHRKLELRHIAWESKKAVTRLFR